MARQLLRFVLCVYVTIFAISLIYLLCKGGDILSALPAVMLAEPWVTLVGHFTSPPSGDSGWTSAGMNDDLGTYGIFLTTMSGLLNAGILWGLTILLKKREADIPNRG